MNHYMWKSWILWMLTSSVVSPRFTGDKKFGDGQIVFILGE